MLIIPSRGKEIAWDTYQDELPSLREAEEPTGERLLRLHKIATRHYDIRVPEDTLQDFRMQLLMLDRPDAESFMDNVREMSEQNPQQTLQDIVEEAAEDTTIHPSSSFTGCLRTLGTRQIEGHPEETVHHAHTNVFSNGFFATGIYMGLSTGLDEIYAQLTDTYDMLREAASDTHERMLTEAFLQLWGTRVLHPFWDGNGRAFGYHAALTLDEEGAPVESYQELSEIIRDLSDVNDRFLHATLDRAGLRILTPNEHQQMFFDEGARSEYMGRLHEALGRGIRRGLTKDDYFFCFFDEGAEVFERHIARATDTAYKRHDYPKQRLLDAMLSSDNSRLRRSYSFGETIEGLAVEGSNRKDILTIRLRDLQLNDAERQHHEAGNRLSSLSLNAHQRRWYGEEQHIPNELLDGHWFLDTYLMFAGQEKAQEGIVHTVLEVLPSYRRIFEGICETREYLDDTERLEKRLRKHAAQLTNPLYEARLAGSPIETPDVELLEESDRLTQEAEAHFLRGDALRTKYLPAND